MIFEGKKIILLFLKNLYRRKIFNWFVTFKGECYGMNGASGSIFFSFWHYFLSKFFRRYRGSFKKLFL